MRDALLSKDNIQSFDDTTGAGTLYTKVPTGVVVEGLSMYLTSKENYQLFQQLGDIVGARGSTIAFDFFHLDDFGRPINSNTQKESSWITAFMKYKVKVFGEPFRWGIAPETLPSFLQDTGWSLVPASESKFFLESSEQDEASRHVIMMGLEYEAAVEWTGR